MPKTNGQQQVYGLVKFRATTLPQRVLSTTHRSMVVFDTRLVALEAIEMAITLAEAEICGVAEAGGLAMDGAGLLRELRRFVDPIHAAVAYGDRGRRAFDDRGARTGGDG
jgi:hypothetical protein